ncbi:MAG: glycine--tRNA ligase subunit beta [Candidatus Eisenbacteria bacterium]|nr:glycine--tRNA ligase subunit beta [Candidatus Eisenbacteria bacterium]
MRRAVAKVQTGANVQTGAKSRTGAKRRSPSGEPPAGKEAAMPRDLLFEIGVEEIPAPYVPGAIEGLAGAVAREFEEARLAYGSLRSFATPRRLAVIVEGLADSQEKLERLVVGPPARIAFSEDGTPTKAATGFARSQEVELSALEVVDEYVQVTVTDAGRPARDVLPEILVACADSIQFPKTMRWGAGARFARPIRWLVAMLGNDVLDLEYAGVSASNSTRGFRFWSPGPHELGGAGDYEDVLAANLVVADHEKRRNLIADALDESAAELCGGRVVANEGLLEEVTFLVEYPTVFAGRFSERFLELPRDVVVAAMKGHQRYFAVESEDGRLVPRFLCVANAPPDFIDDIRTGNERVLESRLDDAAFYWEEDTRTGLSDKVESLGNVVWLEGLGTLLDKTRRLEKLASWLAQRLGAEDDKVATRAARLAKADLVTEMVRDGKEFTELQGTMGREYAAASGEPEAVAIAIYEHYLPRFAGDDLPETEAGTILSIADRIDSIVGCFSEGLSPTGSQDPYALRRQAIGLVRMIDEKGLDLDLVELAGSAAAGYGRSGNGSELEEEVLEFIRGRARAFYIEKGYRYDLVDAVLAASLADLAGVRPRLEALTRFRKNADFEGLVIGTRRVSNILKDQSLSGYAPDALTEPAERELENERARVENEVGEAVERADFQGAVSALLSLRPTIDTFFDDVMVMVEDEELRQARLGLLAEVRTLFMRIADFGKVVLEGEETSS